MQGGSDAAALFTLQAKNQENAVADPKQQSPEPNRKAVGVYDRPASADRSRASRMMPIVIVVVIVVVAVIYFMR